MRWWPLLLLAGCLSPDPYPDYFDDPDAAPHIDGLQWTPQPGSLGGQELVITGKRLAGTATVLIGSRNAEILDVFTISREGKKKVAGCRVVEGSVRRGAKVRLIRDDTVIHEGELSQLKRFKEDVQDVPMGQEFGMSFANYEDLRVGDIIECFAVEKVARTLDDA